jgi:hypothetical protein
MIKHSITPGMLGRDKVAFAASASGSTRALNEDPATPSGSSDGNTDRLRSVERRLLVWP